MERSHLAKEKMARDEAVREKIELEKKLQYFEEEAQRANKALVSQHTISSFVVSCLCIIAEIRGDCRSFGRESALC